MTNEVKTPVELMQIFLFKSYSLDYMAEDVEYHQPNTLQPGLRGSHYGKPAITAFFKLVFEIFYDRKTIKPEIKLLYGTDQYATAVFTQHAKTVWGESYINDYMITITCENGLIKKIYEIMDTKRVFDELDNRYLQ